MLKITVVTPCYNSATFLEETIQSVLEQHDPNLEYIVIDGGSTDHSVDIIKRYEKHLAYWVSESDDGMYPAIQKGFERGSGDIMAWLNADDKYTSWTFRVVREIFETQPNIDWITSIRPLLLNEAGTICDCMSLDGFARQSFLHGENLPGYSPFYTEFIQQESTFWRRSLWEKAGGHLDTSLKLAGDLELWTRFYQYSELVGFRVPLAAFRIHPQQLTSVQKNAYFEEASQVFDHYGIQPYSPIHAKLRRLAVIHRLPLKRLLSKIGLLYKTQIGVFDHSQEKWKTRSIHI